MCYGGTREIRESIFVQGRYRYYRGKIMLQFDLPLSIGTACQSAMNPFIVTWQLLENENSNTLFTEGKYRVAKM